MKNLDIYLFCWRTDRSRKEVAYLVRAFSLADTCLAPTFLKPDHNQALEGLSNQPYALSTMLFPETHHFPFSQ